MSAKNTTLTIEGLAGKQLLSGDISVSGSKNAALLSFPMAMLFRDEVSLSNIPEIEDVARMVELVKHAGFDISKSGPHTYTVASQKDINTVLDSRISRVFRASFFVAAPMLARFGEVTFPHPGGDNIGPRPVDLFVEGLETLGASCTKEKDTYQFSISKGKKLKGGEIFLRIPSVGVTQSLMLAGVLAEGVTTIKNAAMEPEIVAVAQFLNSCGAKIQGVGTSEIVISGTGLLSAKGKRYQNIPDRLDTGTFLILGVLSGKDISIKNCEPKHIEALLALLTKNVSSSISVEKNAIRVQNKKKLTITPMDIRTHEYPGFASDLQPPLVVLLTQAEGKSLVFETIYEERFNYVGNLIQMGAKINTYDPHRIRVHGKTQLTGAVHTSPDIRAGLAYILAAAIAKGESIIHNVYCIDRGYEHIEGRLQELGLSIERHT